MNLYFNRNGISQCIPNTYYQLILLTYVLNAIKRRRRCCYSGFLQRAQNIIKGIKANTSESHYKAICMFRNQSMLHGGKKRIIITWSKAQIPGIHLLLMLPVISNHVLIITHYYILILSISTKYYYPGISDNFHT